MNDLSAANLRLFIRHAVAISLAISISSSWTITDLLLLNLQFDLTRFGMIKSSMFLLPAVSYLAATGLLKKLDRDLAVAAQAYLWRVLLPIILTVVAILCYNREVLLWTAVVIFSLSYSCAMFANNTLLKIYRRALSPEDFNRGSMFLPILMGIPAGVFCLGAVWLLNRFGSDRQTFLYCLLALQLFLLLFEFPGIRAIMAVRCPEAPETPAADSPEAPRRTRAWAIFRHPEMMRLLALMTTQGVWMGLVSTYFVVYLLKIRHWDPSILPCAELALWILAFLTASKVGRLAGRIGYMKVFAAGTLAIFAVQALWLTFWESTWMLIVFAVFIYNGNNGLLAVLCRGLEGTATTALAKPGLEELYIAAGTLVFSLGCFGGCLAAGHLFGAIGGEETARFIPYFRYTLILPPVMFLFTLPLPKFRRGNPDSILNRVCGGRNSDPLQFQLKGEKK